jgi:ABC-type transport system involved in multi-copper enzyme maturation permease subunit
MSRESGFSRFRAACQAEFLKIWASRIPLTILVAVPALTYLFVFELYHVEHLNDLMKPTNALQSLPVVFFAIWKSLLFQAAVVGFSAFWATVDSQYGMVRIGVCQPVTRIEYLVGKWFAISAHVAILAAGFSASLIGWTCLYSGVHGLGVAGVLAMMRFSLELVCLVASIAAITMIAASFRRTVGSGIMVAFMAFIALAIMTVLPFHVLSPRFVLFRYFSFPLGELPDPFPTEGDSIYVRVRTVADFVLVTTMTPLLLALPALAYFRRRDIGE